MLYTVSKCVHAYANYNNDDGNNNNVGASNLNALTLRAKKGIPASLCSSDCQRKSKFFK